MAIKIKTIKDIIVKFVLSMTLHICYTWEKKQFSLFLNYPQHMQITNTIKGVSQG